MLERFVVKNFQSLYNVELELKKLTVIVGRSSSGKSACVRALLTLCNNSRGTPYVSHGAAYSTLELSLTDQNNKSHVITLERGATKGVYTVVSGDDEPQTHSKLGGASPAAVGTILGLADGASDLVVASQFAKPFLLDETGSVIARTFGDLTNVSTLFEAAREANRRKLELNGVLKTRETDLLGLLSQVQAFKTLPSKIALISEIETEFDRICLLEIKKSLISSILTDIIALEAKIADFEQKTLDLPNFESISTAFANLKAFDDAWTDLIDKNNVSKQAKARLEVANYQRLEYEKSLELVWSEMKICPTCGRGM